MSALEQRVYLVIHSDSALPLAVYTTFEQAKEHVDRLTRRQEHASIYSYVLNREATRQTVKMLFDNI